MASTQKGARSGIEAASSPRMNFSARDLSTPHMRSRSCIVRNEIEGEEDYTVVEEDEQNQEENWQLDEVEGYVDPSNELLKSHHRYG